MSLNVIFLGRSKGIVFSLLLAGLAVGCQPLPKPLPPGPTVASTPDPANTTSSSPGSVQMGSVPQEAGAPKSADSSQASSSPQEANPPQSTDLGQTAGAAQTADPQKPQVSGSQRWEYAWNRAMEGTAMGASVAGPYGAGGGLLVGLIAGLFTADAHYKQLNDQINAEEKKDKQLEAQLEKEIERQRQLEAELEKDAPAANAATDKAEEPHREKDKGVGPLASLGKEEKPPAEGPPPPDQSQKKVTVRDVNKDGKPDLWIYYEPLDPTMVQRQEEDTNWDGRVDTWSYFTAGKLARRAFDTDQDGEPDRWFFYESETLAREERDRREDGTPRFRAFYAGGRLEKVERDLDGDGAMDLWTFYDPAQPEEVVLKEERDLDGNGAVDIWSFYENGRLARREVSAVGLKHLVNEDNVPPNIPVESLPRES